MTPFQYKRAPITEAVVELAFNSSPEDKRRSKAFATFRKHYPNFKEINSKSIEVEVRDDGDAISTKNTLKHQFSSSDITQLLITSESSLLFAQLAPYQGWDLYKERITRDWATWIKHTGHNEVNRIGMRYINRIDIPATNPVTWYENYVTVYPNLPKIIDPSLSHSVNIKVLLDDLESLLTLNSSVVKSPIPEHIAIVLDFDISRKFKTAPSNDEIYEHIDLARKKKNEIFEACITDKARELFNK